MPGLTEVEKRQLAALLADLDLDELQRLFEERLAEQDEAHHGGNSWVGTGGTSPFGHSGIHPGGIRVGGRAAPQRREGRRRAPLPRLSHRREGRRAAVRAGAAPPAPAHSRNEGLADELDLDETVDETADHAGRLVTRLAKEPKELGQGAARHGRGRLDAPLHPPLQPALQRREQPDPLQGPEDLLLPQLHLRLAVSRHRDEYPAGSVDESRPARAAVRLQAHRRGRRRDGAQRAAQPERHHLVGLVERGTGHRAGCAGCDGTSTTPCG